MELKKKDQDLVISGHLLLHRRIPELKNKYVKKARNPTLNNVDDMSPLHAKYYFADVQIFQKMYFFLYNLTTKRYKNTAAYLQNIIHFLEKYAEQFALSLPGRIPQCKQIEKV